jgi:putative transposase
MALDQSALLELLEMFKSADGGELMRWLLGTMLQELVDAEATDFIGAGLHERSETRTTQRNGTRDKLVTTGVGDLTIKIPKTRTGSFFPALLAPRRRVDVALHAVICQAFVEGVGTRRVDDLVVAMGGTGISKSEVSRICAKLDTDVAAFRTRPLDEQPFPYVFLDATYCKVRLNGRVVSQAVVIATGVSADGRREVLGSAVGDSENQTFWTEFLRDLKTRGLSGVQLVISDAHSGLVAAVATVFQGVAWQRCRVHFMRNVLAKVSKGDSEMVAALIRTIFAQTGPDSVRAQADTVADMLEPKFPIVAAMLRDAKTDLTAFADFPHAHWRKIWSTNPLERLNREVKRRTDVVGIFPNTDSLLRLSSCVLIEAHDEWQDSERRYLSEESMALLFPSPPLKLPAPKNPTKQVTSKPARATA